MWPGVCHESLVLSLNPVKGVLLLAWSKIMLYFSRYISVIADCPGALFSFIEKRAALRASNVKQRGELIVEFKEHAPGTF